MDLDNDCWRLVLLHFKDDPYTLFQLLMVSRQLFQLSIQILYYRPFNLPYTSPIFTIRNYSDLRLKNLITLCKSSYPFQDSNNNNYNLRPTLQWPILTLLQFNQAPPTTVNYAALVKRTPDRKEQQHSSSKQNQTLRIVSSPYPTARFSIDQDRFQLPKHLTSLIIEGFSASKLDYELLKDLTNLSYLRLRSGYGERTAQVYPKFDCLDWKLDSLKSVILQGTPANVIRGQLIKVAPGLQDYWIEFSMGFLLNDYSSFFPKVKNQDLKQLKDNSDGEQQEEKDDCKSNNGGHIFLHTLTIRNCCIGKDSHGNANMGGTSLHLFKDLLDISEDNSKVDDTNNDDTDNTITTTTTTSTEISKRRFKNFPNLRHLELHFKDSYTPRWKQLIVNTIKVDTLQTLTIGGFAWAPKHVNRNLSMSVLKDIPGFEEILEINRLTWDEAMRKKCIFRLSLDTGAYRHYWMAKVATVENDENGKFSMSSSLDQVAQSSSSSPSKTETFGATLSRRMGLKSGIFSSWLFGNDK